MAVIVAALDGTDASDRVLQTAVAVGDVLQVKVRAVHVGDYGPGDDSRRAASRYLLPLESFHGEPVEVLAQRLDAPDVVLGVMGSGPTSQSVAASVHRPVVVVPPNGSHEHGTVDRVLVLSEQGRDRFGALTDAAEMFRRGGVPVEMRETGDAVGELIAHRVQGEADLVVVGLDSMEGARTVAEVPDLGVPVLVVPMATFHAG